MRGKDPTASTNDNRADRIRMWARNLAVQKKKKGARLTLMESSCCLRANSASLLGEKIRLWRELFGGSVVGTANTLPSESPAAAPDEPSRERGRLRAPAWGGGR